MRRLVLKQLEFPLLKSARAWRDEPPPDSIQAAQRDIEWAGHMVIFYPLWMGDMPALLKAFIEQALRPGFAFDEPEGRMPRKLLKGRSARLVVTMGMPALVYRLFYGAHSVRSFKRNILRFSGFGPVRASLIGSVESSGRHRHRWLDRMRALGRSAA